MGLYALFRYRLTGLLDRTTWGQRIRRGILRLLDKAGPAPSYATLFVLRFISGGRTASMAAAGDRVPALAAIPTPVRCRGPGLVRLYGGPGLGHRECENWPRRGRALW